MNAALDRLLEDRLADLARLVGDLEAGEARADLDLVDAEVELLETWDGTTATLAELDRCVLASIALLLTPQESDAPSSAGGVGEDRIALTALILDAIAALTDLDGTANPLLERARARASASRGAAGPRETLDPVEASEALEPVVSEMREVDLEASLVPMASRLSRYLSDGGSGGIELRDTRRDLTDRERVALGAGLHVDAAPVDRLLLLTAAISFRVAERLGVLDGAIASEPSAVDEQVAEAAALSHLLHLVSEALALARNRGNGELVQALSPVRSRLEALDRALEAAAPEISAARRWVDIASRIALEDFEVHAEAPRAHVEEPGRVVRKAKRSSRRTRIGRAAGPAWRTPVLVAASAVILVGSAIYVTRAAREIGPPQTAAELGAKDLADVLPSATILEVDAATRTARIAVGPEWGGWSEAERRRRVMAAVAALADRGYSRIQLEQPGVGAVATWREGIVELLD